MGRRKSSGMRKYEIRVLNEEYRVLVVIGTREECIKAAAKYMDDQDEDYFRESFTGRGHTFARSDLYPLILVDGDLPAYMALGTLAHEASHAADYIADYICMDDKSGEFKGHTIGHIVRTVVKDFLPEKKPRKQKIKSPL